MSEKMNPCKIIISLIKTGGNWMVKANNLEEYEKEPGVWILYGRKKKTEKFRCYEVGQTSDIMGEVLTDAGAIILLNQKDFIMKRGQVGRWKKYSDISKELSEVKFQLICICHNREEREIIEFETAQKEDALYWKFAPGQRKLIENLMSKKRDFN